MKKTILLALVGMVVLLGAGCKGNISADSAGNTPSNPSPNSSKNTSNNSAVGTEGKVIFSITDAAADMSGVTAVYLTIDKLELHSASKGWITVSENTREYELLNLKAKSALALAAEATVPAGTYNQIRIQLKKVDIVKSGKRVASKLPSNKVEINGQFVVTGEATTSITLDFVADDSIHLTGNGTFIFAPVIKTESRRNADVSVASDGTVKVSGGIVDASGTMGMNVDGAMQADFKIDSNAKLEVKDGIIQSL